MTIEWYDFLTFDYKNSKDKDEICQKQSKVKDCLDVENKRSKIHTK